jgi:hypothetical protein
MNSDSEADRILAWLFNQIVPNAATPSGQTGQGTAPQASGTSHTQLNPPDPLDSEEAGPPIGRFQELTAFSFQNTQRSKPGDTVTVEDRFHALLKRRLQAEIERNPPLFPWESELLDYEADAPELVPNVVWATQLRSLNLPVTLPESVLKELFEKCQSLVQSSLKEGARLVQAVESLFPGQSQALNSLAGYVMAAPARSGAALSAPEGMPKDYEAANPAQQMALSLMAAREILHSLSLPVSKQEPSVEREWQTESGSLTLKAEIVGDALRVRGMIPCGGRLQLQGGDVESTAHRPTAGVLSVELCEVAPNRVYTLEVQFEDESILMFAVQTSEI